MWLNIHIELHRSRTSIWRKFKEKTDQLAEEIESELNDDDNIDNDSDLTKDEDEDQ